MALLIAQDKLSFCDAVRAAIDISLSDGNIPDKVIELSIYQGAAENWVLARDPNAANYQEGGSAPDSAKYVRVKNALTYKTASLLCPAVPAITRDDFGADEGYSRAALDTAKRADELAELATAELNAYLESQPVTASLPPFMAVAPGYRGR
jgi:hypothetical protein